MILAKFKMWNKQGFPPYTYIPLHIINITYINE